MKQVRDYYETKNSPVVKWNSIRLVIALVCLMGRSITHIGFVLVFTQPPVERGLYMRITKSLDILIENEGRSIVQGNSNAYLLQVHRNVYGSKIEERV